ncbi:uncharacterized protein LY89DRAFT_710532 [Mollisia scopiformis]|uniref:Zn(2)-C6 fungal-type domain-containing protein n=1 Tax=Mollisia scopiformis TaxID=149040 RepID=A0A194WSV3_MOLSC|nr:uncharacterized protein LY89DRAFT_710532 [Mollisia scopiformis]KUJ10759.1 hypothetical protein LY89DRAFT_710532 [Mollisia scopiformis]
MSEREQSTGTTMGSPNAAQPTQPALKRRRVAKACESCRSQKSKCDGEHPICGRCKGYGHVCSWPKDKKDKKHPNQGSDASSPGEPGPRDSQQPLLQWVIQSYDNLIASVQSDLPESTRNSTTSVLSQIRGRLPAGIVTSAAPGATSLQRNLFDQSGNNSRYLGEASDVRFFHTIKKILRDDVHSGSSVEGETQSYDQEILRLETHGGRHNLPTKEVADAYIEIYFFTIHIAYPFLNKPSFMVRYARFWTGDVEADEGPSWLPLLYTIFAIGAYYTSFPRGENANVQAHLDYFGQAMSLSNSMMTDCTLENVQMLIAQCFFLLAMGQTDRCWNTLGLAIRVAQSIGLHVQDSREKPLTGLTILEQETIRRTWYSLYVLDRLLALQLGRPIAIHEDEYYVNLPSESEENACLFDGESNQFFYDQKSCPIDYFVSVIEFSRILGQVISDLYRPSQVAIEPDKLLSSTADLDEKLIEWKLSLPRHLRFDLGHTFEKSMILKRQRNMLAIKFHHLRTLMHRPYLCLAWVQQPNRPLMALLKRARYRVDSLERICVHEAQQTAHLLHNVADEKSLVHDFPWWQMISCLLCASSVLLVARACIEPDRADLVVQSQTLDEDAETCLKVFDALSVNSDAARRARDMMKDLKRIRILPSRLLDSRSDSSSIIDGTNDNVHTDGLAGGPSFVQTFNYGVSHTGIDWQTWPGELSDPMAWSAQFLNPSENVFFNSIPVSDAELPQYTQYEGQI